MRAVPGTDTAWAAGTAHPAGKRPGRRAAAPGCALPHQPDEQLEGAREHEVVAADGPAPAEQHEPRHPAGPAAATPSGPPGSHTLPPHQASAPAGAGKTSRCRDVTRARSAPRGRPSPPRSGRAAHAPGGSPAPGRARGEAGRAVAPRARARCGPGGRGSDVTPAGTRLQQGRWMTSQSESRVSGGSDTQHRDRWGLEQVRQETAAPQLHMSTAQLGSGTRTSTH